MRADEEVGTEETLSFEKEKRKRSDKKRQYMTTRSVASSLPGFFRRLRQRAGLTLVQVAEKAKTTSNYVNLLEIGDKSPSWERLLSLLVACDAQNFLFPAVCLKLDLSLRIRFFAFTSKHKAFVVFSQLRELKAAGAFADEKWKAYVDDLRTHAETFGDVIGLSSEETLTIYDLCFDEENADSAEANILAGMFTLELERWFAAVTGTGQVDFSEVFRE